MKLTIPEVLRTDRYWDAVGSSIEDMLEDYYLSIKIGDKAILDSDKDELLIRAESLGIGTIFKRIPVERGRQLINEFNYMIKSKGSSEAIKRMIQIYLGVVNCELFYISETREYSARLVYGELAGTDSSLIDTVYEAVRYVNPVGRLMRELNLIIEPIVISLSNSQTQLVMQRYRTIYGSDLIDLDQVETVGYYRRNFRVYPKKVNRDHYNSIYPFASYGLREEIKSFSVFRFEDLDSPDLAYLESRVRTNEIAYAVSRSEAESSSDMRLGETRYGRRLRSMEVVQ